VTYPFVALDSLRLRYDRRRMTVAFKIAPIDHHWAVPETNQNAAATYFCVNRDIEMENQAKGPVNKSTMSSVGKSPGARSLKSQLCWKTSRQHRTPKYYTDLYGLHLAGPEQGDCFLLSRSVRGIGVRALVDLRHPESPA